MSAQTKLGRRVFTDLSDLCLSLADLIQPHKLLVLLPPVVYCGSGCLSRPLTPLPPKLTCMLKDKEKREKGWQCSNLFHCVLKFCCYSKKKIIFVPIRQSRHAPSEALIPFSLQKGKACLEVVVVMNQADGEHCRFVPEWVCQAVSSGTDSMSHEPRDRSEPLCTWQSKDNINQLNYNHKYRYNAHTSTSLSRAAAVQVKNSQRLTVTAANTGTGTWENKGKTI